MTFDINAHVGQFALRRLRHDTPESLLTLLDAKGIERALVSPCEAVMWKDCHLANELLAERIAEVGERLVHCAVVNPAYAGWASCLDRCRSDLQSRALKLYPHWHGYELGDACCDDIVAAATQMGMPVILPMRVVDRRQLGWLFDVPDLATDDIAALVARHPSGRFVVTNGIGIRGSQLDLRREELPDNYWIEISRLSLFISGELPALLSTLGARRLVFGTGAPFKYIDPVLLKMDLLQASDEEKLQIMSGNASELIAS